MKHATLTPRSTHTVQPPSAAAAAAALAGLAIDHLQVDMFGDALYVNGVAACYDTKQEAAQRLAQALPGVCIINELRVAHSGASDAEIAREVSAAVSRISVAAAGRITIDVEDGEVSLRGTTIDQAEAAAIEAAAWASLGVRHVHHRMTCAHRTEPAQIERALGEYIARSAGVPGDAIAVRYDRGIVELTGDAASAQQREAIEDLVRWHESVIDVVNAIRVTPAAGAR